MHLTYWSVTYHENWLHKAYFVFFLCFKHWLSKILNIKNIYTKSKLNNDLTDILFSTQFLMYKNFHDDTSFRQCLIDIRYFNEHNYQGTKRRGEQKVRRQVHIFARLKTHCEREFGDMSSAHWIGIL